MWFFIALSVNENGGLKALPCLCDVISAPFWSANESADESH